MVEVGAAVGGGEDAGGVHLEDAGVGLNGDGDGLDSGGV